MVQCGVEPHTLAAEYVREPYFRSHDQVLATVRYMVAVQLARDPLVRSCVRDMYMQRVCVSARPTMPRGFKEIDEAHPCFRFKYLRAKPCSDLKEDEYLKLAMAEQDGLLTLTFELSDLTNFSSSSSSSYNKSTTHDDDAGSKKTADETAAKPTNNDDDDDWDAPSTSKAPPPPAAPSRSTPAATSSAVTVAFHKTVLEKLKSFYHKDEFSYNVEQWNAQRSLIIEEMCHTYLFVEYEKELRARLLHEARTYVFKEAARRLGTLLRVAPYTIPTRLTLDDDEARAGLRVLAIAYSTFDDASTGGQNKITNNNRTQQNIISKNRNIFQGHFS